MVWILHVGVLFLEIMAERLCLKIRIYDRKVAYSIPTHSYFVSPFRKENYICQNKNNNNEAFIFRHKMQKQTQQHTSLKQPWIQNRIDMSSTYL